MRMKAARIFNPLYVLSLGSPLTDEDIDSISTLFRFSSHPKIAPKLVTMKAELPK